MKASTGVVFVLFFETEFSPCWMVERWQCKLLSFISPPPHYYLGDFVGEVLRFQNRNGTTQHNSNTSTWKMSLFIPLHLPLLLSAWSFESLDCYPYASPIQPNLAQTTYVAAQLYTNGKVLSSLCRLVLATPAEDPSRPLGLSTNTTSSLFCPVR